MLKSGSYVVKAAVEGIPVFLTCYAGVVAVTEVVATIS